MMSADIPTMLTMIVVASLVMAAAVGLIGWGHRQDGLERWAGALMLHGLAYVLMALRGRVPDWMSILGANAALTGAFALMAAALLQFFRQPLPRVLAVAPLGVVILVGTLLATGASYNQRVALLNLCFAAQLLAVLWPLSQPRRARWGRGAMVLVTALMLMTGVLLTRAFVAWRFGRMDAHLLAPSTMQTVTFLGSFVALLGGTFGFLSMSKERADRRNVRLASEDELTGVANRRAILEALQRQVHAAQRSGLPLSVLMLDLDHFKRVNDARGHQVGDQVLRHVMQVVCQGLRAQDTPGRYGGEEFLILLPGTPPEGARALAQRLRQRVAQTACLCGDEPVVVTVSIGVAGGVLQDVADAASRLIRQADAALYAAKHHGRDRVEVFPLDATEPLAVMAAL